MKLKRFTIHESFAANWIASVYADRYDGINFWIGEMVTASCDGTKYIVDDSGGWMTVPDPCPPTYTNQMSSRNEL